MTDGLKSSFDLAMERLAKRGEGMAALSEEKKEAMTEITRRTQAKIAEVEILYGKKIAEIRAVGDEEKAKTVEAEKRMEIARVRDREEAERERVRNG